MFVKLIQSSVLPCWNKRFEKAGLALHILHP